jgi:uncharacterized protein Veg
MWDICQCFVPGYFCPEEESSPCASQGIEKIKKNCKVNIVTVVISHSGGGRRGWQRSGPVRKFFSAFFFVKYLKF